MLKPIAVDELRSTTICHPKVKIFCARPNLLTEALYKSIRISGSEGRIWKRQGIENIGGAYGSKLEPTPVFICPFWYVQCSPRRLQSIYTIKGKLPSIMIL